MKLEISYNFGRYKSKIEPFLNDFDNISHKVFEVPKIKEMLKGNEQYFLDVSFVSENEIKKINKTYRHIDKTTDVISFAFWDEGFITPILGEMFICYKKTVSQANEYGHDFRREICFLFVHGLLHILGYDHMNVEDEKIMFGLQETILDDLGIKR